MASVGARIAEQYPYLRFLANDPQVGPLLRKAVDLNTPYSEQRFFAELMKTNWWRKLSDTQRQAQILRSTKPGEYKRQVGAYKTQFAQAAAIYGIRIPGALLNRMSKSGYSKGYEPAGPEMMYRLSLLVRQHPTWATTGGRRTAARMAQQSARREYLYHMSDKHAAIWGDRIARGIATPDDMRQAVADRAAQLYPQFATGLRQGKTMEDMTDQYRTIIAEELEIDPDRIDLSTGQWSKVLNVRDSNGKTRPMTNFETLQLARKDPRWWKTGHGKQEDASWANRMLAMFGRRAPSGTS